MEELPDFGPLYTETNLNQFPVEPFNTGSNLLFLIVAIYWYRKLKHIKSIEFKTFLVRSLPLLVLGYIGGTIYHATRSHFVWILMDVLPIYAIAALTSHYLWQLISKKAARLLIWFFVCVGFPGIFLWSISVDLPQKQTILYAFLSIPIVLPLLIDQLKMNFCYAMAFLIPCVSIGLALFFRAWDSSLFVMQNIPMGTHWLWHSFGAITCHFLLSYLDQRSSN